jgi:hypothetical protein
MERIDRVVNDWIGKKIIWNEEYYSFVDTHKPTFTIVSYIDSLGCISCKLQLNKWNIFKRVVDSISKKRVSIIFIAHGAIKKDIKYLFDAYHFYPNLCIMDVDNRLNTSNQFPQLNEYQTFLLDNNNKVLAIGNPIHNPKVKDLYLKIIRGDALSKNKKKEVVTTVSLDKSIFSMGTFSWEKEQNTTFLLKNIGDKAFVINDVTTSCGCTSVEYSKEPIRPGKSLTLHVTYKADHPGHFDKTVSVYCNVPSSPIQLRINGNAD